MKRKLQIPVLLIFILLLARCHQDDGVCISSTGKVITQDRAVQPYRCVEIYDNINVFLTQDSTLDRIVVEAGKNLIDGITTRIDSGKLSLRNENSCSWLRSFEVPVNVYLTFGSLDTIIFRAAGDITCTNVWTGESVNLDVIEGAGKFDLRINAYRSNFLVRYGTTDIKITGFSEVTTLITSGFGPFHAEGLTSKFTYVKSFSPNDMYVYSNIDLAVEIGNIGNVYYTGNPATLTTNIYGEGKLIEF
jgi:hypothetical protein